MTNLLFEEPNTSIWQPLHNKRLLAAFSGGKDSLSLLHYLYTHKNMWHVSACHINHDLRGEESNRDMLFCQKWCDEFNIAIYTEKLNSQTLQQDPRGLENAARVKRYEVLEKIRRQFGFDYILTAHTFDDQIESFFVDLYTGSSLYTMGGILKQQGKVYRPILNVTTEMVQEYLIKNNLTPVYDSSNRDIKFTRNMVRNNILPHLKNAGMSFTSNIVRLQEQSRELNTWLDSSTKKCIYEEKNCVTINRKIFNGFSLPQQRYILGKWISIRTRGGKVHTDSIVKLLNTPKSLRIDLPQKYICEITPNNIRIFPREEIADFFGVKTENDIEITINNRKISFSGELKNKKLIIRSRKNGDKFKGVLLKKLFSDKKVDLYYRDRAILLEEENNIIWVEYLSQPYNIKITKA